MTETRFTDEERAATEGLIEELEAEDEFEAFSTLTPTERQFGPFKYFGFLGVRELEFNLLGSFATLALYKPNHVVLDGGLEGGLLALGVGKYSRFVPVPYLRLTAQFPGFSLTAGFLARLHDEGDENTCDVDEHPQCRCVIEETDE